MFRDILLPVDLADRETHARAVETAVALARNFGAGLHVLTVVPDFGMSIVATHFPSDYERQAIAAADATLHDFVGAAVPPDCRAQCIVGHGSIYREILRYADETGCDLIVMTSHRPELKDYLLGPNAARVVRHASQSVMVVRN